MLPPCRYFVFSVLEFMSCENVELVRDIGDGTGIPFCYDPKWDTFAYDHTPFAFAWICLTILGVIVFQTVLAIMNPIPTVVKRQGELVSIIHKTEVEVSMVVRGLSPTVVKALEVIFGQLDRNPIFRLGQGRGAHGKHHASDGRAGDGEVPSYVGACVRACVCVCVGVRACVRACVCSCMRACMRACVHACVRASSSSSSSSSSSHLISAPSHVPSSCVRAASAVAICCAGTSSSGSRRC